MGGHPWGKGGQGQSSHACRGYFDDGSPYPRQHPDKPRTRQGGSIGGVVATGMREIVFLVTAEQPGRIEATAPERGLVVEAPTLEELHHEARDALIRQVGPSHGTYRIRIRRAGHAVVPTIGDQPAQRHPLPKTRPVPVGASRGIGRPFAVELDHNGPTMMLIYTRSPEAAAEVVAMSTAAGGKTCSL